MFKRLTLGHRLKGASRTETPSNMLFVSASGVSNDYLSGRSQDVQQLRLWHASAVRIDHGRRVQCQEASGSTVSEFALFQGTRQRPRNPLWIFSYDCAYVFSLLKVWNLLDDGVFSCGPIKPAVGEIRVRGQKVWKGYLCLESSPVFASLMGYEGKIILCDVLNYFHCGQRQLCDSLQRELVQLPPDDADDETHLKYLKANTETITDVMVRLMERWRYHDCGPWAKTSASLSLSSYRRFIGGRKDTVPCPAPIVARHEECEEVELAAFYGGRCEPFFLGEQRGVFYKVDVASLYPHVMAQYSFPCKRVGMLTHINPQELWRQTAFREASAEVLIESLDDTYPVKHGGYLTYARGRFWTALCGPELRRAIQRKHVKAVGRAVLYDTAPLFKTWVEHWYSLKKEASLRGVEGLAERQLSKLVINSLYGKFSQRGNRWKTVPGGQLNGERWGPWTEVSPKGNVKKCRAIAGVRQEWEEGEPPAHYFPAISAFVTAHAREYMRGILDSLPPKSCYYIGTDMLIIDELGYESLQTNKHLGLDELGKFTLEEVASEINVCAPMWYKFGDHWTRNGSWGRARQDDDGLWCYDATDRLPSILSTEPDGTVTIRTHLLCPTERWAKGFLTEDGWVRPYSLTPIGKASPKEEPSTASSRPQNTCPPYPKFWPQ